MTRWNSPYRRNAAPRLPERNRSRRARTRNLEERLAALLLGLRERRATVTAEWLARGLMCRVHEVRVLMRAMGQRGLVHPRANISGGPHCREEAEWEPKYYVLRGEPDAKGRP